MNRGELREEVEHLVESEGGTFDAVKTDRALNRAAQHYHNLLGRAASIQYARGSVQFTLTALNTAIALPTLNDMKRPRSVRAVVAAASSGFRILDEIIDPRYDCCLIPERMRDSDQYRGGLDLKGRPVCFLSHSASRRNAVQTVSITAGATTGTWTIGIAADLATVDWDVTPADLKTALEALESIGAGQIAHVSGTAGESYVITFAGTMGFVEVDELDVTSGTLDGGAVVSIATTAEGVAAWSITFLNGSSSGSTYELVYDRNCRVIPPGISADVFDLYTYETIPDEWHYVLALRAAISVLGIHNESQSALIEEHNVAKDELAAVIKAGQSAGTVQQTMGW